MRSGIKDLCAVLCSLLCLMAMLASYAGFTKGDHGLYTYAIAFVLMGTAVGMFALK